MDIHELLEENDDKEFISDNKLGLLTLDLNNYQKGNGFEYNYSTNTNFGFLDKNILVSFISFDDINDFKIKLEEFKNEIVPKINSLKAIIIDGFIEEYYDSYQDYTEEEYSINEMRNNIDIYKIVVDYYDEITFYLEADYLKNNNMVIEAIYNSDKEFEFNIVNK